MLSINAAINNILNSDSHLIGNTYGCAFAKGEERKGFKGYSKMFCDNIVFWCLVNKDPKCTKSFQSQVGTYMGKIRAYISIFGFSQVQVKFSYGGTFGNLHPNDSTIFPEDVLNKFCRKKRVAHRYLSYISIKVTLAEEKAGDVCYALREYQAVLEKYYIYLHDVDMTVDCYRITSRNTLRTYLVQQLGD